MKRLWIALLLVYSVALTAQQLVVATDEVREMRAKLADWPQLGRYAKENAELPPPAPGVKRVVFFRLLHHR